MAAPMAQTPPHADQRNAMMRDLGRALTHSLELVIAVGIGVLLGWKAQQQWPGIEPWGIIGGLTLGGAAMFRSMWRIVNQSAQDHAHDGAARRDG